jgi:hypothetical protein
VGLFLLKDHPVESQELGVAPVVAECPDSPAICQDGGLSLLKDQAAESLEALFQFGIATAVDAQHPDCLAPRKGWGLLSLRALQWEVEIKH